MHNHCRKADPDTLRQVKEICYDIGHYYQSQNDFFDFYSETNVMRKPGTDIEDNRITWLALTAMDNATPPQKSILTENYGKKGRDNH